MGVEHHRFRWICTVDGIDTLALLALAVLGLAHALRYAFLGSWRLFGAMAVVELLIVLAGAVAWRLRLPAIFAADAIAGFVLGYTMNYSETTMFNVVFYVEASVAALAAVAGTAMQVYCALRKRPAAVTQDDGIRPMWARGRRWLAVFLVLVVVLAGVWQGSAAYARNGSDARHEVWDVPSAMDAVSSKPGSLQRVAYQTKAYATDRRSVTKAAYVYLPYGYTSHHKYDILYLLHGTGQTEADWLKNNQANKNMLDQLIARRVVTPMIVVTPSFYVGDDCRGNLDALTYSFNSELRNDLMPFVESRYSTYAASATSTGFTASRDHRAFAGLSRGAVTAYHSAMCQSLDYFSWFGTFSGSRTSAADFQKTIRSARLRNYPIRYLYVSTGIFDFAGPGQVQDYRALLNAEPRLKPGINTRFDVFPMRYHSMGSWHLALYDFLQNIFKD